MIYIDISMHHCIIVYDLICIVWSRRCRCTWTCGAQGFGFVSFASPDEATKAVTEMHLKAFSWRFEHVFGRFPWFFERFRGDQGQAALRGPGGEA